MHFLFKRTAIFATDIVAIFAVSILACTNVRATIYNNITNIYIRFLVLPFQDRTTGHIATHLYRHHYNTGHARSTHFGNMVSCLKCCPGLMMSRGVELQESLRLFHDLL